LNTWSSILPDEFPNYRSGSWGPESSDELIARDNRSWFEPIIPENQKNDPIIPVSKDG
jgi:glucose-6-phosphate 1-dehydrogenase